MWLWKYLSSTLKKYLIISITLISPGSHLCFIKIVCLFTLNTTRNCYFYPKWNVDWLVIEENSSNTSNKIQYNVKSSFKSTLHHIPFRYSNGVMELPKSMYLLIFGILIRTILISKNVSNRKSNCVLMIEF